MTDCTVFICASKSLIPGVISYIKWVETLLVFHFISGPKKENERSRSVSLMTAIDSLLYLWYQKMENTFYRNTLEILGSPGKSHLHRPLNAFGCFRLERGVVFVDQNGTPRGSAGTKTMGGTGSKLPTG